MVGFKMWWLKKDFFLNNPRLTNAVLREEGDVLVFSSNRFNFFGLRAGIKG